MIKTIEQLMFIFKSKNVGIAIYDFHTNSFNITNAAFAIIYKYEPHEISNVSINQLSFFEDIKKDIDTTIQFCSNNNDFFESIHECKDKSKVTISIHISFIENDQMLLKKAAIIIYDKTKHT